MKKYIIVSALALIAIVLGARKADANPSQLTTYSTSSASSTPSYMTPGTATTTLYVDTQSDGGFVADSMSLAIQFIASSSSAVLQVNQEYALLTAGVDCSATPRKCDWYEGSQGLIEIGLGTSTNSITAFDLAPVPQYSLKFASSTDGLSALDANNNRMMRTILFKSPTRYTRFIFTLKPNITNANGAVWAVASIKRQTR